MTTSSQSVTELLIDWSNGDRAALDRLLPLIEVDLHRLASYHMRREQPDHLLQTTALVNEAYLRLVDQTHAHWKNRAHFFAVAAQIMRRILVDDARSRQRFKRGGDLVRFEFDEAAATLSVSESEELLALDEALARLAQLNERKARVVEMRFFGGLSIEEMAGLLGISPATVERDWDFAKVWLRREMER
jgi:RNA polymerase sigma factor (TIGR02999 family)